MNQVGGFGRGFDRFAEHCGEGPASCVTASFEEFLGTAKAPFFAFLFYFDPHAPYQPPAEHRRFATHLPAADWVRNGDPKPIEAAIRHQRPVRATPEEVQGLVDLYDDEIAYVDAQIGQVFAALDAHGIRDETLVILVADHGEMFLEHGDIGHCRELYDSVVHTPFVLWGPGGSGRRVRAPVANLDVVPTILDYLRIPIPSGLAGRSLRPLVEGVDALPSRAAVCASMLTQVAASDGRFKLVRDVANGAERLYDRATDPGETTDRRAELTGDRDRLAVPLDAWIVAEHATSPARTVEDAKQFEQRLRNLGYVE
jgi:arylsulfatase A-like enzyme